MDATPQALERISRVLPATGTTSYLATTMTMARSRIEAALENIRRFTPPVDGAEILGVHMEGPFVNASRAGAQDAAHIAALDAAFVLRYADVVTMVTFAPELSGAEAFVSAIKEHAPRIVLSAGHSDATYEEATKAFEQGVGHVTHLFNAMRPYHHREPGLVGACFDSDATCDVIADGVHTHRHHLRLLYRMKPRRWLLITDAMRAGCMKEGSYDLGGQRVAVEGKEARLEDGTLAGSVLKMNEALATMREATGCSVPEAVAAVTQRPAALLGLAHKGKLEPGYDADVTLFDERFRIKRTFVKGRCVYEDTR